MWDIDLTNKPEICVASFNSPGAHPMRDLACRTDRITSFEGHGETVGQITSEYLLRNNRADVFTAAFALET